MITSQQCSKNSLNEYKFEVIGLRADILKNGVHDRVIAEWNKLCDFYAFDMAKIPKFTIEYRSDWSLACVSVKGNYVNGKYEWESLKLEINWNAIEKHDQFCKSLEETVLHEFCHVLQYEYRGVLPSKYHDRFFYNIGNRYDPEFELKERRFHCMSMPSKFKIAQETHWDNYLWDYFGIDHRKEAYTEYSKLYKKIIDAQKIRYENDRKEDHELWKKFFRSYDKRNLKSIGKRRNKALRRYYDAKKIPLSKPQCDALYAQYNKLSDDHKKELEKIELAYKELKEQEKNEMIELIKQFSSKKYDENDRYRSLAHYQMIKNFEKHLKECRISFISGIVYDDPYIGHDSSFTNIKQLNVHARYHPNFNKLIMLRSVEYAKDPNIALNIKASLKKVIKLVHADNEINQIGVSNINDSSATVIYNRGEYNEHYENGEQEEKPKIEAPKEMPKAEPEAQQIENADDLTELDNIEIIPISPAIDDEHVQMMFDITEKLMEFETKLKSKNTTLKTDARIREEYIRFLNEIKKNFADRQKSIKEEMDKIKEMVKNNERSKKIKTSIT